jgi:hypothetical protein
MIMPKRAISLTLEESNLLWLKGLAARSGARSLSEAVDRIVSNVREGTTAASFGVRSIVGSIEIPADDPDLTKADAAIRQLFAHSLARPWPGAATRKRRPGRRRRA